MPEKEKAQWITKIDRVVSSLGGGSSS
jgi:hypothetical protein